MEGPTEAIYSLTFFSEAGIIFNLSLSNTCLLGALQGMTRPPYSCALLEHLKMRVHWGTVGSLTPSHLGLRVPDFCKHLASRRLKPRPQALGFEPVAKSQSLSGVRLKKF